MDNATSQQGDGDHLDEGSAKLTALGLDDLMRRTCDRIDESICITDAMVDEPGPRILYVNRGFEQMTGYTRSEVLGRTPRILQGPRSDRAELSRLREALTRGTFFIGETWNYRRDGSAFLMQWAVSPIHDESGQTACFLAVQRAIGREREQAIELASRRLEMESITRSSPDAILRLDETASVVYANPAALSLIGDGADNESLAGSPLRRCMENVGVEAEAHQLLGATAQVLATGDDAELELRSPFAGKPAWIDVRIVAVVSDDGEHQGVLLFVRDVSDRVAVTQRLRASEARERARMTEALRARETEFRELAEHAPLVIAMTEPDGRIAFANNAWMNLIGRDAAAFEDAIQPADQTRVIAALQRSRDDGITMELECLIRTQAGHERMIFFHAIPRAVAAEGKATQYGLLVTGLDITDQRQREQTRQEEIDQLAHASRLTLAGQIAGAIVHEVAQPLSAAATFIEVAMHGAEEANASPQTTQALADAQESALRAGQIARRMLNFVRRREPNATPVSIGDCIRRSLLLLEADARRRSVRLDAPSPISDMHVDGDALDVEQVLCNLIRNGIEAVSRASDAGREPRSPEGDIGSVAIVVTADDTDVMVDVIDDGDGVAEGEQEGLFEAFRSGSHDGLGLGLWVCWNIVERLGGELRLEQTSEAGSVFRMRLPLSVTRPRA